MIKDKAPPKQAVRKPEPDVESSGMLSSSMSLGNSGKKIPEAEHSYASDTFEEVSMSGSGSKGSSAFGKKVGRMAAMGKGMD